MLSLDSGMWSKQKITYPQRETTQPNDPSQSQWTSKKGNNLYKWCSILKSTSDNFSTEPPMWYVPHNGGFNNI